MLYLTQFVQIEDYLSKNKTKDLLGVPRSYKFNVLSFPVNQAFTLAGDIYEHSEPYIVGLLERGMSPLQGRSVTLISFASNTGVRVLIYVGTNDMACNFVGNYRMVQALDWSGGDRFAILKLRDWMVNGHVAGEVKSYGRLTFATVRGAGHLVSQILVIMEI